MTSTAEGIEMAATLEKPHWMEYTGTPSLGVIRHDMKDAGKSAMVRTAGWVGALRTVGMTPAKAQILGESGGITGTRYGPMCGKEREMRRVAGARPHRA